MSPKSKSSVKAHAEFQIDLNLDAGESEADFISGKEEALYQYISSVNIACGGHAGTENTMRRSIDLAIKYQRAVGAHPSYPDLRGFGRQTMQMPKEKLIESLREQISALEKICNEKGVPLHHIKPHGALYNEAAVDLETAQTLLEAFSVFGDQIICVGLAGSVFIEECRRSHILCASEGFIDRRYEPDGTLRSRSKSYAHIDSISDATTQALQLARGEELSAYDGSALKISAQTLCLHGDRNDAVEVAKAVSEALATSGIKIRSL